MKKLIEDYIITFWNRNGWTTIFITCFIFLFCIWFFSEDQGTSDFKNNDISEQFSPFVDKEVEERLQQEKFYEHKVKTNTLSDIQPSYTNSYTNQNTNNEASQPLENEFIYEETASKGENECRRVMEKITGKPFMKVRPQWLKNPVTKTFLELDIYNPELNLAVEYNGIQHDKFVKHFHGTKEAFRNMQYRDYIKGHLCEKNGTYLIIVRSVIKNKDLESYLVKEYKEFKRYRSLD